jgi:hypothetical protein
LILSVTSVYIATREPDVVLVLPDTVRLVGGRTTGGSYLYLQPAFVSTGNNDRVEVIRDMRVTATPDDGGESATLDWQEQVDLVTGEDGTLSYRYVGDAVPLAISSRSTAAPVALFQAPKGWFLRATGYRFTLVADRVVTTEPLTGSFQVTIAPADLEVLDAPGPERFLAYRIES